MNVQIQSFQMEYLQQVLRCWNENLIYDLINEERFTDKMCIRDRALAQRMWDASPYDVKVHMTLDRREALPGADFVTTQFRVGLLNARIKDERIPFSYGMLGQETNGAGGIFKAFRTIPVILGVVEDLSLIHI